MGRKSIIDERRDRLHETNCFDVWLAGLNKKVQKKVIDFLKKVKFDQYPISERQTGVDSIIESALSEQPDFDQPEQLTFQIENNVLDFIDNISNILYASA